jgi:cytochrome c
MAPHGSVSKTFGLAVCAYLVMAMPGVSTSGHAGLPGDPAAGAEIFKKCLVCHTKEAGKNKIGPSLFGVVGRHSAAIPGYAYSPAMKTAGMVWTDEELDRYLTKPQAVVSGTKMTFPGLPDARERGDLIAYLKTLR